MGNCLKGSKSSRSVWAETDDENDHWVYYSDPDLRQKQSLLSDEKTENAYVAVNEENHNNKNDTNREVKIMLSKKQLEELMGTVDDLRNIPVDRILDRLTDSSNRLEFYDDDEDDDDDLQQPWKPSLQSIPEEN